MGKSIEREQKKRYSARLILKKIIMIMIQKATFRTVFACCVVLPAGTLTSIAGRACRIHVANPRCGA